MEIYPPYETGNDPFETRECKSCNSLTYETARSSIFDKGMKVPICSDEPAKNYHHGNPFAIQKNCPYWKPNADNLAIKEPKTLRQILLNILK